MVWSACALAELMDFPPVYGLLDAHALWHCGTPATVWLWYQFARRDAGLAAPKPEPRGRGEEIAVTFLSLRLLFPPRWRTSP